ncbi:hypothetical protein ACET6J_05160 [Aeromonas veronii]|uniref:endonuclease toxin domain-containing protein n=1 Tax=Aeromonas veronii TaxID=654 RepID=UPI0038EF0509
MHQFECIHPYNACKQFDSGLLQKVGVLIVFANREIQIAVPANTTKIQWTEINRAIEYGKNQGVIVKVTQVK